MDGTTYSFDLIHFSDEGEVLKHHSIAQSWSMGGCTGSINSKIDLENNILKQEYKDECYDDSEPDQTAESHSISEFSLDNLSFDLLKTDTIQ